MTIALRYLFSLSALLLACLLPSFATSQERTWISEGLNGDIVARDCAGCDEDIGIMIACQGEGGPALISVPFAASNERPGDGARITFQLDRDEFAYDATVDEQGAVGFVPQFGIRPNDPLIAALQSAREARVTFEGRETRIGLKGSRSALEIFSAHCAWTGLPFDPTPLVAASANEDPADGPTWFTSEYANEAGAPTITLIYGVPETDNILLATTCVPGTDVRSVTFNLSIDTGAAPPGAAVEALVSVAGNAYAYPGKVYAESSEYAGLSFDVGSRAPLWSGLRAGGDLKFGIAGGVSVGATANGAAAAVDTFTAACFAPATTSANAPLVNLNLDGPSPNTAPSAAKPLITLNLGSTEAAVPSPKPLINLAAPDQATSGVPVVKLDLGALQAPLTEAGAIPPDGDSYLCDDGSILSVKVEGAVTGRIANVAMSTGETLALAEVQSSFAERYAAGEDTLRLSGGILLLTRGSSRQFCEAR